MTDHDALLKAIATAPDEDTPRLMLADLLQEHGDDARAEFIRVQVELSRLPPKPHELFVADGEGKRLEGLGVALTPRGDGHYSASNSERGLSLETFAPGERVDIYAHLARNDRIGWMRGMRYVKHVEGRHEIIFRKGADSGPWKGIELAARERELLAANEARWRKGPTCFQCNGFGSSYSPRNCTACHGTGDAGGLLREFDYDTRPGTRTRSTEPVRVHFERGFIRWVVAPTLDALVQEWIANSPPGEPLPDTTYLRRVPSPWLRAVLTATPERALIREVVPLDRKPQQRLHTIGGVPDDIKGRWFFALNVPASGTYQHWIPPYLSDRDLWTGDVVWYNDAPTYPTREDAVAALGCAVVTWARREMA